LLDQALAFCDGKIKDADVADMLGSLDPRHIRELLQCLVSSDAMALIANVRELQELVPDYESVLDDLATVLQQIAVMQLAGANALDEDADRDLIGAFAGQMSDEVVQLYYQIAVHGRRDLELAPDPRVGFEMTLLRMLAFEPGAAAGGVPPVSNEPNTGGGLKGNHTGGTDTGVAAKPAAPIAADAGWEQIVGSLHLGGAARQLAESCHLAARKGSAFTLEVPRASEYLLTDQQRQALVEALKAELGADLTVKFVMVDSTQATIADQKSASSRQGMQAAQDSIHNDPNVKQIVEVFNATVEEDSIKPVNGHDG
jgi:DNA polymerase-3 subunit gamma/tau